MWLEESREPTEHILNEMLEHAEKFHEFENSISFMIRTPEAKQDPLLAKVLKMFPNVSIYTIPLKKTLNFWEEECTLIQTASANSGN